MGCFDYCCIIKGDNCELNKSQGQDCSYGDVYLVDKELTKKLKAIYTGYGYAEIKGEEIFDLGFEEEHGLDTLVKSSFLSCQVCAKTIDNEVKDIDEFFTEDNDSSKEIILKEYEKELNNLISKREKLNKLIKKVRKNIADLNS